MPMRTTMRGTVSDKTPAGTMLSKNNLLRSSQTQPAPIRRSDSSRIETWRDEVTLCCGAGCTPPSDFQPKEKEEKGRLSRVTSKVFKRRSTVSEGMGGNGEVTRTSMYDGSRPGESYRDEWDFEGGGPSMYMGSMGVSEGGRLDRAEQLLNRGCGDEENKVQDQVKGMQQAAV